MQCSIVNYQELIEHPDLRTDGEFLCFEPYKNTRLTYKQIGSILKSSQYGISIEMNEENIGTKIYRMNEISNMLCHSEVAKCAKISRTEVATFLLHDRDVLFNRTNSQSFVGRTGLYKNFNSEEKVFASYLVRITPDESIVKPEYLTTFLNTKYGIADVKRRARASINQSNVNPEELKRVEIPIIDYAIQELIKSVFDHSFIYIKNSEKLYNQAQEILLKELGLDKWQPKHKISFIKNYSEVEDAERFDAEYYQPKYDELLDHVTQKSEYSKKISEIQTYNSRGLQPKYSDEGAIDVITSKHILENGLDFENFDKTECHNWELQKKARIPTGSILTYTTGANIGRTAFYHLDKKAMASNHVNILTIENEDPLYVAFVMNSIIGRLQTERLCAGSAQEELYPRDIEKFIIPFIKKTKQKKIAEKIQESFKLREQSKHLLESAKTAVEMAIEKDEKTALKWLKKETKGIL